MKVLVSEKYMLLRKTIMFFAITLFSVLLIRPVVFADLQGEYTADDFYIDYSKFDWDAFEEQSKEYWEGYCDETKLDENGYKDCTNKIIKSQKKFYTKMYKLLTKYQKKGLYIQDKIINETVFFDVQPSSIADDNAEYEELWHSNTGIGFEDDGEEDQENEKDFSGYSDSEMQSYMANEKDTLKILIKNMIVYPTTCYGIYGDVIVDKKEDGTVREYCEQGNIVNDIPRQGRKCASVVKQNELGYWEYQISKWKHGGNILKTIAVSFLGKIVTDPYYDECMDMADQFDGGTGYVYAPEPKVSEQHYFDWLIDNKYFDKKQHLQYRYYETILEPAGATCMTEDLCGDESLEAKGLYDDYMEEIYHVRETIVYQIVDILRSYGLNVDYANQIEIEFTLAGEEAQESGTYYWPIGSAETEVRDGVTYADGDPSSTTITSYFGYRTHPVTGAKQSFHYGVDIGGTENVTNIIAAAQGEVISVTTGCVRGDTKCGGGYGNHVVISHSNGDFTYYAHMYSVDAAISVGTTVQKGQVLGKVGSTGSSTGPHLHFEIRQGGNSVTYAVDPLNFISATNARPVANAGAGAGDFSVKETALTRDEFISKLRSYCDRTSCSTTMINVFVANAGTIYDVSVQNHVNPELVVVRAMSEGFSPGQSRNNYWGIGCTNTGGLAACHTYSSLEDGIKGFANTVSKYNTASDMMKKYAYIGAYWYNPGSWSVGGCPYFPYIQEYMEPGRVQIATAACSSSAPQCSTSGGSGCTATTASDQSAYATWQVNKKMGPDRYNIFGLQ